MSEWFREFFGADYLNAYGPRNRREAPAEARFIESAVGMRPGGAYLDLCCGEGRHAVPLAGRGFRIVGLDRSPAMLEAARRQAGAAGAAVEWVRADSRSIPFAGCFDGVWCWFSTFGYFDDPDDDLRVLDGVRRSLRPGGPFLLEALDLDWHRAHPSEEKRIEGDGCRMDSRMEFSAGASTAVTWKVIRYPGGRSRRYRLAARIYSRAALREMLERAGFAGVEFLDRAARAAGTGGPPDRTLRVRARRSV